MAENKKNTNLSETSNIIKNTVSEMKNKNKKAFKACIALIVLLAVVICGSIVTSVDSVKAQIVNAIIPNEMEIDQTDLIFYSEPDPDYDSETSQNATFDMFRCYYYPDNDKSQEKVYLEKDGIYHYPDGQTTKNVALVFVIAAMVYMSKIMAAFKIVIAIIVVALVVLAIYMWYRADEKRYKAAQEKIKKIKKRSH